MLLKHLPRLSFCLRRGVPRLLLPAPLRQLAEVGLSIFYRKKKHDKESERGGMRAVKRKTNVNRDLSTELARWNSKTNSVCVKMSNV